MSEEYRWVVDKIADSSLRGSGDVLVYAALCNALNGAAPDQARWSRGAEAFVECLERGQPLAEAYFEALNVAAPDGGSWESGIYKINDLANGMSHLASITNNWSRGLNQQVEQDHHSTEPNNPRQKFLTQVQTTIKELEEKGIKPHTTKDSQGTSISGWIFEQTKSWNEDKTYNYSNPSTGAFEETWGSNNLILATDGQFYHHVEYVEQKRSGRGEEVVRTEVNRLEKYSPDSFVGNKGEPFNEIIAKLKRFPYRAYSLA